MKQAITSNEIDLGSGPVVASGVLVTGNVEGDIQVVNKKIEVSADHGAVVNVYDTLPRVKKRDVVPQPTRPLRGFVNRTNELKRLSQIIAASEVVTLQGMDGMGKSALLKQAANSSAARALPDGVLFMEGVDERGQALGFEDLIQRLFDKSFESEPHLKVNFDTAQTYLGNLKSLVVLNGLDLSAYSLSRMVDLYSQSAVLIESNEAVDDDLSEEIRLGPLPRTESIELLVAKLGVTLDDDTRPILDSICVLLADVPLAVVIAARAIHENGLSLERALAILTSIKPHSAEVNRHGIERAYALAQSTLNDLERQWLAAAAFAPGISIDPEYLHQMAKDKATATRAQEHLQSMGLLTANSPRLRIDPGLRELARVGVDEISLPGQFLSYLKTMLGSHSLDWSYCADELGNILGMIDWAARQQRWDDVIVLGRGIDSYLTLHGLWEAWYSVLEDVLQSARQFGDRVNEAWALHQLGTRAIGVGLIAQAIDFLRQALSLRSELGDTIGMAYTQHNLDLLIPPTSSDNNNGQPPDKPFSPAKALKFLLKTTMIGAMMTVSIYWVVHALHSPSIPPTPAAGIPISGATTEPTVTSTKTLTLTPTTPTKTPTWTPTNTRTVTSTASPTEVPSGIGVPQLSTNQLYFGGARCDPNRITIRVSAVHPAGIKIVVFFHRLHEMDSGKDSGWSDGLSMNTKGDGFYTLSVSGDTLIGNSGITSDAWASYQFVIQAKNGEWVRSTVYTDLTLLPCGSGAPRPPITTTVEPLPTTGTPVGTSVVR